MRAAFVKPVRRACARGSKFGQDASASLSASEMSLAGLTSAAFNIEFALTRALQLRARSACVSTWFGELLIYDFISR